MKYFIALFLSIVGIGAFAQPSAKEEKDYLPQLKTMNMSLVGGMDMGKRAEGMLKAGFTEQPELQKYFLEEQKNVRYFRQSAKGADLIYEFKYLSDGRVYQMNLYMAHSGAKSDGTGMFALKIVFNNSSKKIVEELGMPTKYHLSLSSPYADDDYEDNDRAMLALKSFNMVNSAKWYSKKYKGSKWEETPVIELSMHFTNRVRCSVTDIELLKLAGKS